MKNTIFLFIAALFFGISVNAQTTVDSIHAKYQLLPMPEALTIEKTFPVIGSYQLQTADSTMQQPVTITLDQENKGMVWVEGLPEGKFKAYLKKSPATYRIIAQKSETGKQIPEGTMIFDEATNTLNVAMGKKFDDADPAAIFTLGNAVTADAGPADVKVKTKSAKTKTKARVMFYTATKAVPATTTSTTPEQQQQQQQQ